MMRSYKISKRDAQEIQMNIRKIVTFLNWGLSNLQIAYFLVSYVTVIIPVSDQDKEITRQTGSGVGIYLYKEIPAATEPCTPEEAEWWKQLRQTGNDLQKKNDKKSKTKFLLLLQDGQQKAYRVPLKDRPLQILVPGELTYNRDKYKVSGAVEFTVELRSDGSVGDVKIIKGLDIVIDEDVVSAWRKIIFLPAIKNSNFVTHQGSFQVKFWHK